MAVRIFINYRRGEDSGFAQALFIRLEQAFPSGSLFMDVDSIAPGVDFVRHLNSQVAQCEVLLALIGRTWLDATGAQGRRRLDDPEDFVRIEIASALKQGKRVIPVLLYDTKMPAAHELPEDLQPLTRRQAVRLTHERFRADVDGLIHALQESDAASAPSVTEPPPAAPTMPPPVETGAPVASGEPPPAPSSVAAKVEALAMRYEAINIGVISLLTAVLLIFGSYMTGVLDVEYRAAHKQLGFLWAPNWSFNYLILFTAYNCLFCFLVARFDEILRMFHARGVIVASEPMRSTADDVIADWRLRLRGMTPVVWCLTLGVPFTAFYAWFNDCYQPLIHNDLLGNAADWSTLAIVEPSTASRWSELVFTAAAYIYMGFSSWVYLFVLAYAATCAAYLNRLAHGGRFRLVFRARDLAEGLHDLLNLVFGLACLGFLAAYTGRVQSTYVMSTAPNIFRYMFATELDFVHGAPVSATAAPVKLVTSSWVAWPIFIFAAVMFGLALLLLQSAYANARANSRRQPTDLQLAGDEADGGFWQSVAPSIAQWVAVVVLMTASLAFPQTGSLLIAGVLCMVSPAVLRRSKPSPI